MKTSLNSRRILIYGDSITFARTPGKFTRYDNQTRWPGVLQVALGDGYDIIEEGLRARMLKGENAFISDRDGYKQLGAILASHLPLDAIIIMLGINDACTPCGKTAQNIANDLRTYFPLIESWCAQQHMPVPKIIIMPPPITREAQLSKSRYVYTGVEPVAERLPALYKKVAEDYGAFYLDVTKEVEVSKEDGVHLDAEANTLLGQLVADFVKRNERELADTRRLMKGATRVEKLPVGL